MSSAKDMTIKPGHDSDLASRKPERPEDEDEDATITAHIDHGDKTAVAPTVDSTAELEAAGAPLYDETYPEGGYGYVVLFACVLIGACTAGSVSALGVYQAEYAERFPEKSSFQINLIGGFMGFFMAIGRAVFGRLCDRYGLRRMSFYAAMLSWIGMFAAGFCDKLWQLYLTQGIVAAIGQGGGTVLFSTIPAQWFKKRRGLAFGLGLSGAAVFSQIVPPMINAVGVKHTLKIIACTNLVTTVVGIGLCRTRRTVETILKKDTPFIPVQAMKHSLFWLVSMALLVGFFGTVIPAAYFVQYTRDIVPQKKQVLTSLPLTLWSLMTPIGRILFGILLDQIDAMNCYCLVWLLSGVTTFCLWYPLRTYAGSMAYSIVLALFGTSFQVCLPGAVGEIFGPEALATNLGFISLFNMPASLFAAPIAGVIRDDTKSWKWMIVFAGTSSLAGGLIAVCARFRLDSRLLIKK